jgi:hypothetical protein
MGYNVEHDIMIHVFVPRTDQYSKIPAFDQTIENDIRCSTVSEPQSFSNGINQFLKTIKYI